MRRCVLAMLGVAVLAGCPQPDLCTTEAVPAVKVTLRDSISKSALCDGTVTITEGNHTETAQPQAGDPCSYVGAFERPGSYTVSASHPTHRTASKSPVVADPDHCHVMTQEVALELAPL